MDDSRHRYLRGFFAVASAAFVGSASLGVYLLGHGSAAGATGGAPAAFVQALGGNNVGFGSSCAITTSAAVTQGDRIVVIVHTIGPALTAVTDSAGDTFALDAQSSAGGTDPYLGVWSANSPAGMLSAQTITATVSGNSRVHCAALELRGVPPTGYVDAKATSSSVFANPSLAATATQAGDVAVAAYGLDNNCTDTAGTGFTLLNQAATGNTAGAGDANGSVNGEYESLAATGVVTSTMTFGVCGNQTTSGALVFYKDGGTNYFVSPGGSDANAGTSAAPFKTLDKCYATVPPNTICGLQSGTYTDTTINAITTGAKATTTPIAQHSVCAATCVIFQPVLGAVVSMCPPGHDFRMRASHVEFLNFKWCGPTADYSPSTQQSLEIWPQADAFSSSQTPDDVDLNGITGLNVLNVACSTNWRVENSNIGVSKDTSPFDVQAASQEKWTVSQGGTWTGGTFTITATAEGVSQTTAAIAWNATAATVAAAVGALTNVGASNVTGTGGPLPATTVTLAFASGYQLTANAAALTGTAPSVALSETATDCQQHNKWGTVYNVTVHDSATSNPSNHVDCTHLYDSTFITFDRVQFYGCEHINVFMDAANWANNCCANVVIQNSVLDGSKAGACILELAGGPVTTDFTGFKIENSDIVGGADCFDSGGTWPASMVIANSLFPQRFNSCETGSITWSDNAMTLFDGTDTPTQAATNCATSGNFRIVADTTCIVSDGNINATPLAVAPNPHLVAGSSCDNTGNTTDAPAYDLYNVTRANPPDVGAAEG